MWHYTVALTQELVRRVLWLETASVGLAPRSIRPFLRRLCQRSLLETRALLGDFLKYFHLLPVTSRWLVLFCFMHLRLNMSVGNGAAFDPHLDVIRTCLRFIECLGRQVGVAEKPYNRKLSPGAIACDARNLRLLVYLNPSWRPWLLKTS